MKIRHDKIAALIHNFKELDFSTASLLAKFNQIYINSNGVTELSKQETNVFLAVQICLRTRKMICARQKSNVAMKPTSHSKKRSRC